MRAVKEVSGSGPGVLHQCRKHLLGACEIARLQSLCERVEIIALLTGLSGTDVWTLEMDCGKGMEGGGMTMEINRQDLLPGPPALNGECTPAVPQ